MATITVEQALHLAISQHQTGQLVEAETIYRQILTAQPDNADILHRLGVLVFQIGRAPEARELVGKAIAASPTSAHYYNSLGLVLENCGEFDLAAEQFGEAIRIAPAYPIAHYNLGNLYTKQRRWPDAIAAYRAALQFRPDYLAAYHNLAATLIDSDHLDEAVSVCRAAIQCQPADPVAYNNLANAFKNQGRVDAAMDYYRQALALDPTNHRVHSNLVYTAHFCPSYDSEALQRELWDWNRRHALPVRAERIAHLNEASPNRRLRIGYVSPNFREHVVGRNMLPLLREHDRTSFDIVCYSDANPPDPLTKQFRTLATEWRDTSHLDDAQLAAQVQSDRIDILIDLTLHMAGNRLLVFARKPAPVQASFAGYPGTTGLDQIDYRLTDPYLEPPGPIDTISGERPILLSHCFWCYAPRDLDPPVAPLPALTNQYVTFGCLNTFAKVNAEVVALWGRILVEMPTAHMVILAAAGRHRDDTLAQLAGFGVDPSRIRFVAPLAHREYLSLYGELDVALDTFPYNGHSTTCDALWMGVPVISLVGRTVAGRGGLSILANAGLPELVTYRDDDYVDRAIALARDLPRLAELRKGLRARMNASPLMDAKGFTRGVEAGYREMWRRWCASAP